MKQSMDEYHNAIASALRDGGIHRVPKDLIGQKFHFSCEHDSHYHSFIGTITGILKEDEGCSVELFVSIPQMWGQPLSSLVYDDNEWFAVIVENSAPRYSYLAGKLELL